MVKVTIISLQIVLDLRVETQMVDVSLVSSREVMVISAGYPHLQRM